MRKAPGPPAATVRPVISPANVRRTERQRARVSVPTAPLTADQYEAARLGHPGLSAQEAAYYVHESERYLHDLERWSRDAMPEDWQQQHRWEREMYARERREPGGRFRHAMYRRECERRALPDLRYRRATELAEPPF